MPVNLKKRVAICRSSYKHLLRQRFGAPLPSIVIATTGRAETLCRKTLTVLRNQRYPLRKVHLFVPHVRDPTNPTRMMRAVYREALRKHRMTAVHVHRGGQDMLQQCRKAVKHFRPGKYLLMMSDNIDSLKIKTSKHKHGCYDLPCRHFQAITAHAYHITRWTRTYTWSLASCKSPLNMQAGMISRKFGLIDGNCYGWINRHGKDVLHKHHSTTVDLEWSCLAWQKDGGFFRYQYISAIKKYRSGGGFRSTMSVAKRKRLTSQAIKRLAKTFPHLVRYNARKEVSNSMQPYTTLPVGPQPLRIAGDVQNRGRPRIYMSSRSSTSTERMRVLRKQ